jgi:REP element-mobilizing transposase RayT
MDYPAPEYPQPMADTYTKILIHCVFSTKNRTPQITQPEKLWTFLRGIARNHGLDVLAVGGTANHVHILLALPSIVTVSNLVRDLKANSSRHLNEKQRGFAWQDGYAAISVSPSQIEMVRKYIDTQDAHQAKWSFESEYIGILEKSGVRRSTEYLWIDADSGSSPRRNRGAALRLVLSGSTCIAMDVVMLTLTKNRFAG